VMVDGREIEEAWRVGCSTLILEKSKESNHVRCENVDLLPVTTILEMFIQMQKGLTETFPGFHLRSMRFKCDLILNYLLKRTTCNIFVSTTSWFLELV
ncbi:hypothetical protein L9F63_009385, partial [Diploptera punctata]